MRKLLQLLFGEGGRKSIVEALPLCMNRKQLEVLAQTVSDPRSLVDIALKLTTENQTRFLRRLSNNIGYPLLEKPSLEIVLLELKKFPLSQFEKLGVFPILQGCDLQGIWAVDPFSAQCNLGNLEQGHQLKFYLGTWGGIQSAWRSYENLLSDDNKQELQWREAVAKLLLGLAEKIERSQIDSLSLTFSEFTTFIESIVEANRSSETVAKYWEALVEIASGNSCRLGLYLKDFGNVAYQYSYSLEDQAVKIQRSNSNLNAHEADLISNTTSAVAFSTPAKNILIIDDSSVFSAIVKKYLHKENCRFKDFVLPKAAIQYLRRARKPIDLIICDLHMPDFSGREVLEEVRKMSKYQNTPFVLLTSEKDVQCKIKFFEQGVRAYIEKDEDPRLISAQIKSILSSVGTPTF